MLHAVGFLVDHRYIPDEYRNNEEAVQLQNRIKQVKQWQLQQTGH